MIFDCQSYKTRILSQRTGQIFLNMVRHPLLDPKDLCSETFVSLPGDSSGRLRKQRCILTTYGRKGWQSAVEACCARLLEDFSGNNAASWMMDQFDLTFRPIFDAEGGRLIRPPSLGFWFGCIQKKLNSSRSLSKSLP